MVQAGVCEHDAVVYSATFQRDIPQPALWGMNERALKEQGVSKAIDQHRAANYGRLRLFLASAGVNAANIRNYAEIFQENLVTVSKLGYFDRDELAELGVFDELDCAMIAEVAVMDWLHEAGIVDRSRLRHFGKLLQQKKVTKETLKTVIMPSYREMAINDLKSFGLEEKSVIEIVLAYCKRLRNRTDNVEKKPWLATWLGEAGIPAHKLTFYVKLLRVNNITKRNLHTLTERKLRLFGMVDKEHCSQVVQHVRFLKISKWIIDTGIDGERSRELARILLPVAVDGRIPFDTITVTSLQDHGVNDEDEAVLMAQAAVNMWLKNAGCWAQETQFNIEKRNEAISPAHARAANGAVRLRAEGVCTHSRDYAIRLPWPAGRVRARTREHFELPGRRAERRVPGELRHEYNRHHAACMQPSWELSGEFLRSSQRC